VWIGKWERVRNDNGEGLQILLCILLRYPTPYLLHIQSNGGADFCAGDSDDELYDPLMDDNESNAISELLAYLENVCPFRFMVIPLSML